MAENSCFHKTVGTRGHTELTETRYSAFDRELFAAFSAISHFRFLLEGRDFILFTDHKPLTHALFRSTPPWSACQLSYISKFTDNFLPCQVWKTVIQMHCLALLQFISPQPHPQLHPQPGH